LRPKKAPVSIEKPSDVGFTLWALREDYNKGAFIAKGGNVQLNKDRCFSSMARPIGGSAQRPQEKA
jgi:hypothetical protein